MLARSLGALLRHGAFGDWPCLQVTEVVVQAVESLHPEAAIGRHPVVHFHRRLLLLVRTRPGLPAHMRPEGVLDH